MQLNKKLLEVVAFNPTKKTFQMSVADICQKILKEEITLPLYQRDVSWTLKKCVDLLNYQLIAKAPVSPISINQINFVNSETNVQQVSFIDREIIQGDIKGKLSVTDGQQRLTTNFKAYINHSEFRNIVLDLVKGEFIIVQDAIKKYQIPAGILLNKDISIFFDYLNNNSTLRRPENMNILIQIRNKIRDYNYTINLAEDLKEDEQIEWFEVLNNAGSRVSRIQMRFSKLKMKGIDIYSQYTSRFKIILEENGMDLFRQKETEVSIPIAALNSAYEIIVSGNHTENYSPIPSDTKENQLCSLEPNDLKECFKITLNALNEVIQFINNNNLEYPNRIDYITYLIGFFVFNKNKKLSENQIQKLINWYKNIQFTNKSNGERRKMFTDLLKLRHE